MAEQEIHDVPDHLLIQDHNQLVNTQLLPAMHDPMIGLLMLVTPLDVLRPVKVQATADHHFLSTILQHSQLQQMTLVKIQVN